MSKYIDDLPQNILRDLMNCALGTKLGGGIGRQVFIYDLNPKFVVKIEDCGFQNVIEHELWRATQGTQFAKWFAPVRHISGLGTVLFMDRTLPAPRSAFPKKVPEFLGDLKYSNFGLLNGKLVCHDYGTLCNFLHAMPAKAKMLKAKWWDAGDGSSFSDSKNTT